MIFVSGALIRRGSLDPDRRRLSLGTVPHRGSDVGLDPNHAAILFRDSRGVSWPFIYRIPFQVRVAIINVAKENRQN